MIFSNSDAIVAIDAGLPINPALLTLLNDGLIIKISLFFILNRGLFKKSDFVSSML